MTFLKETLIENTTKEERQIIINKAVALGSIDSLPASEREMELFQKYIDGEMELEEVKNTLDKEFLPACKKNEHCINTEKQKITV